MEELKILLFSSLLTCSAFGADFAADVYPLLQKAGCPGCHNHDGVASATRMKFPEADATLPGIEEFGRSLQLLVNRSNPQQSLLLTKPTTRVAHAGGKRIEPGSKAETLLLDWVNTLARGPEHKTAAASSHQVLKPSGPALRRLTHAQYNNTIRDLLGDDSRIADQFPPEDFVGGFRNQYSSQNTSPLLAEAYSTAAEKLARKVFAGSEASRLIPCKPSGAQDLKCAEQFIQQFGAKAFRRPLSTLELARYRKLFTIGARSQKSFSDGARLVVEAMLQSPNFLLRTEDGLDASQRGFETASRLSYFLWNSMPDAALFKDAESGALKSPDGVKQVVARMLKDKRAESAMNDFLAEWLRFDRLLSTIKDRRTYPQYTPELAVSMVEETRRLFADLVWSKRSFMDLYSSDYSFVSSELATLYGVQPGSGAFARVQFPASAERAGILGHATFLTLTSKPAETSPTARGLFVREQFLCQEVPQPPPGVSTNLPALTKARPLTTRERLGVHLGNESCASCHTLIDPIGFGFEKFDAIGQRRDKQKILLRDRKGKEPEVTVELDLDTKGYVAGLKDSAFSSPRELGKILADSAQCQECVVKQLFRYAAGRHETAADRVVIGKAFDEFKQSGFQFQELLISLSKWLIFPPGRADGIRTD